MASQGRRRPSRRTALIGAVVELLAVLLRVVTRIRVDPVGADVVTDPVGPEALQAAVVRTAVAALLALRVDAVAVARDDPLLQEGDRVCRTARAGAGLVVPGHDRRVVDGGVVVGAVLRAADGGHGNASDEDEHEGGVQELHL